jgi:4-amino-4-deoxy-L-arabinose transferase-like glycosyltransferase
VTALLAAIERHPARTFALFAMLHLAVWSALPAALYPNLPLDLIEAHVYGREWQLGYDKLPPLPWWLVEIVHRAFGADFFYYALAQVAVLTAFALVWRMARVLVGAAAALVSVLLLDGLHYFHFTAAKFNHDVIQLPFWALAGVSLWAALKTGRTFHWVLLGAGIGLALWAKYFVAVLALPIGLFLLIDRDARRALATPGPYVAAMVAFLVAFPHLYWLVQNDFLPFRFYVDARVAAPRGLADHILRPAQFALSQIGFILPVFALAIPLFVPRTGKPVAAAGDAFDRRIVAWLAFGPMATVVAMALVSGRATVAMWGYPLWMFLGLWLVMTAGPALDRLRLQRVVTLWACVFGGFAVAFVVAYAVLPAFDGRYRAVFFPGDRLGAEMSARYRAMTGRPLAYVVGTMWTGGNVSHYAPERPRVLIDGRPVRAPWIDLGDLSAKGAVVVWTDSDPRVLLPAFRAVAVDAEVQEPFTLPYRRGPGSVTVGWAVLRPRR